MDSDLPRSTRDCAASVSARRTGLRCCVSLINRETALSQVMDWVRMRTPSLPQHVTMPSSHCQEEKPCRIDTALPGCHAFSVSGTRITCCHRAHGRSVGRWEPGSALWPLSKERQFLGYQIPPPSTASNPVPKPGTGDRKTQLVQDGPCYSSSPHLP
jgi:hypothetical protein